MIFQRNLLTNNERKDALPERFVSGRCGQKFMRTSKEYEKNIKSGIITQSMLRDCLYSVNKRAKNCRDKEREYKRCRYYKYGSIERYHEKKEQYYVQKEILLSVLKPICIHKELYGYERRRIYEYEPDYEMHLHEYVWENCYWDGDIGDEVWFGDIELKDCPLYHYYLFYDMGERSFHTPINEMDVEKYPELKVVTIDQIITYGNEILELASTQFVKKVIALIQSGQYQYKDAA